MGEMALTRHFVFYYFFYIIGYLTYLHISHSLISSYLVKKEMTLFFTIHQSSLLTSLLLACFICSINRLPVWV